MSSSPSSTPSYIQHPPSNRRFTRTTIHTDPRITIEQIHPFHPSPISSPSPPPPPAAPTEAELRKRRKEAREADAAERREIISDMREDTYRDITYVQTLHEKLGGPGFLCDGGRMQAKEEGSERCIAEIAKLQTEQKRLYDDHKMLEGNQKHLEEGYKKLVDGQKVQEGGLKKVREDLDVVGGVIADGARDKALKGAKKEGVREGKADAVRERERERSEPVVVKQEPDSTWGEREREKLDEVWKGLKDLTCEDRIKVEEEARARRQDYFPRKTAAEEQDASDFRYAQELDRLQRERAKASQSWYPHSQPYSSTAAQDILDRDLERGRLSEKRLERESETRTRQYLQEQERREDRRREDRSRERRERKESREYMERDRNMAYGMLGAGIAAGNPQHQNGHSVGAPLMISGWQQQQYQQPLQAPVLIPIFGQSGNGGVIGRESSSKRRLSDRLSTIENTMEVNTGNLGRVRDGVDGLLYLEREREREKRKETEMRGGASKYGDRYYS